MNTINVINKGMENHLRQNAVDTPLISVIIPVYKVEDYLDRCLQSIINQTYKNLEIILVDDGSPDKCPEMCDKYAEEHVNIRVIHKENGGSSSARNAGLSVASGQYIAFVDSDDWIAPDMYEYLFDLLVSYNADLSDVMVRQVKSEKVDFGVEKERVEVYSGIDILEHYLYRGLSERNGAPYSACRKLFKRALFFDETSLFSEGTVNEDICFNYRVLTKCSKIVVSNQIKYYYFQEEDSISNGKLKRKDLALLNVCQELECLAKASNSSYVFEFAKMKTSRSYFSLLARAAIYGIDEESIEDPDNLIASLRELLKKNIKNILVSPMPISRKILAVSFVMNYKFSCKIIRLFHK